MNDLDTRLREILLSDLFMDNLPANIHQEPITKAHTDWANKMVAQIKQAFADEREKEPGFTAKDLGLMTGKEWLERFEKEYHMRADWIEAEPDMGTDAGHDVLLAAKLASGLDKEDKL